MKKGSLFRSTITFPKNFQHNYTWKVKEWSHPEEIGFSGMFIWSDGINVYETHNSAHRVLKGNTWVDETPDISDDPGVNAIDVWTDGSNIYYTCVADHYLLVDGNWKELTVVGYATGEYIWSDGEWAYYSRNNDHFTRGNGDHTVYSFWIGESNWNISGFNGHDVWSDGKKVYVSYFTDTSEYKHYVLVGGKWEAKEWNVSNFVGREIWTDGTNTYLNASHVLKDGKWESVEWKGLEDVSRFFADHIWSDGTSIYYSDYSRQFVLEPAVPVPRLNPAALMQGFATTLSLRRMRGVAPPADETDAVLEDGILYIKNASAVLKDGILEVK